MKRLLTMFLLPVLANAQTGVSTQDLLTEPATLLDIGMVRLELLTSEFEDRVGLYWTDKGRIVQTDANISPHYDAASKKIHILFNFKTSDASQEQMMEACENATIQMEHWLRGSMPSLFLHSGDSDPSKIPEMFEAFEDVILLRCYFSSEKNTADGRFWAYRYLGNRETTIGQWKAQND